MAGNAQGQFGENQLGAYKLLWAFGGDMGGDWLVYAARHVDTAAPALVLRPKKDSVWAPQKKWQGRVYAHTEPPYLVLEVDRLPDLYTLPAITDNLDELATVGECLEYRREAAEHLRSRPRQPPVQEREAGAPAVSVPTLPAEELGRGNAVAKQCQVVAPGVAMSVVAIATPEPAVADRTPRSQEGRETTSAAVTNGVRETPAPTGAAPSSPHPVRIAALRAWRPYRAALAVASLTALVLVPNTLHEQVPAPERGTGGAALAGLAKEALAAPEALPVASFDINMTRQSAVGLDMPFRAFKGQRFAPCEEGLETEIELRDGKRSCWVEVKMSAAKCKEKGYEWKGACYWPSIPSPRAPSSTLSPSVPPMPATRGQ